MTQHQRISRSFYDLPKNQDGVTARQSAFVRGLRGHKGFSWEELLKSKRVQIICEAGTGKTYECMAEQEARWEAGEAAFFIELSQLGSNNLLTDLLSEEEVVRYEAWLKSQSDTAILFLDSYDELKLTRGSFETALKRLGRSLSGQLGRIKIVITTRPIPFDDGLIRKYLPIPPLGQEFDDKSFADVMMGGQKKTAKKNEEEKVKEWQKVELLPLSDAQIADFAETQGIEDTAALLADIRSRNAEEFARRPQDLIELCTDWRDHHRIRTHLEQVANNVAVKLKAPTDREEKSELDNDKAIEGASRLALAMLLTRKLNLRFSVDSDKGEAGTALEPLKILTDWSAADCQTLMERALFGFAGYGRVRFHNQSVIEYLAAHQLKTLISNGMTIKAIKRILFAQTAQGVKVVKPSMRPVAAWLALSNESVFRELRDREPEVLMAFGDPESLTTPQRIQVLSAYFERFNKGSWRGHNFERIQLKRFGSTDLAGEVSRLLDMNAENLEVRQLLFELVSAVPIAECADKAFAVAMERTAEVGERIYAAETLSNLNDDRVKRIVQSMVDAPEDWPDRLFTNTIIRFFPASIDVASLGKLLENRPKSNRESETVADFLIVPIEDTGHELTTAYLDELRAILTSLVLEDVKPQEEWPHLFPKRKHLLAPLAAACLRLLKEGQVSDPLLESSIATLRLARTSNTNETQISDLRSFLHTLPTSMNEQAFWIADSFNQKFCFGDKPRFRIGEIVHHSNLWIGKKDANWIHAGLKDSDRPTDQRSLLLEAAIHWTWDKAGNYADYLQSLKSEVADCELLVSAIDERLRTPEPNPEIQQMEKKNETNRQKQIREDEEAHASWIDFWKEVSTHPEIAFGEDQLENTTWNLWIAMKRSGEKGRASGWNRRFIEQYFGKETADRLRVSLMAAWRKDKPTFRSERPTGKKSSFLSRWELGLAGVAAESEDIEWASRLCTDEVELATRYISVEYNGLPNWLGSLAAKHPESVEVLLGRECTSELDELADANGHFFLLQKLRYADPDLATLLVPRLHEWFNQNNARVRDGEITHKVLSRLIDVAEILLTHSDENIQSDLREIATHRLNHGVDRAYLGFWLSTLLRLDPEAGTVQLEKTIGDSKEPGLPEEMFAQLFGNHRESSGFHLGIQEFPPALLLRLVKLAYDQIKPVEDNVRDGRNPSHQRNGAQRGRGSLLNAILATEGPDAWAAKIELANDPVFSHFRDRALALATEKAAEEMDSVELTSIDMVKLYSRQEAPPKTRDAMFEVLVDRLDDIDDLLLHDDSPREAWALINDERIMRREIARQLRNTANDAYTVDQESVTADEKETDTRLRSTASLQQAVIELKLGEKDRSGRELRDTLRDQLVKKYMADDNCRSGCLLITIGSDRQWQHPETNVMLDPVGLEEMLLEEASKIEAEMGHSLRLTAKVIDLQPRLKTEKTEASN